MPELPEVEIVCRGLKKTILGCQITSSKIYRRDLRIMIPQGFEEKSISKIRDIKRRAKYIQIHLDNDNVILMHLGMSGRVIVNNSKKERLKHDHIVLKIDNEKEVVFNDPRRFGLVDICHKIELENHKLLTHLGPDPFSEVFNIAYFMEAAKRKSVPIKNFIMDNGFVVGVGNIYACESLFRSKISPQRPTNKIKKNEAVILIRNICDVLNEAIEAGGSTLKDYVNSSGQSGYFQHKFSVYSREGEECYTCNTPIKRIKQSGRSSFFCDNCQS